jgi:hypothetical protein
MPPVTYDFDVVADAPKHRPPQAAQPAPQADPQGEPSSGRRRAPPEGGPPAAPPQQDERGKARAAE